VVDLEGKMETATAILTAGTDAVNVYKEISGSGQDNEVPERFMTSLMAVSLRKTIGLLAKAERQYTQIAEDLGLELDAESRRRIIGLSADIALYDGALPAAVIEAKRLDERTTAESVRFDMHKGDPFSLRKRVQVFLAVMVCEVEGEVLAVRKAALERATGCRWQYSYSVLARDGQWHWCFGCGLVAT